jgi:hypothetical protein
MRIIYVICLSLMVCVGVVCAPKGAKENDGSVGVGVLQLHNQAAANGLGYLVVVDVAENTPAARAGIENGDVILEIDGVSVLGKPLAEAGKPLKGAPGAKVHLKLGRPVESRLFEVDLVCAPYGLRSNPSREPFAYKRLDSWRLESVDFPLPWSPGIPYHGIEDLIFAAKFDDKASAQYHTYAFVWWLDGKPALSIDRLKSDLMEYFRGLSVERGQNNHFKPDLAKVGVKLQSGPLDEKTSRMAGVQHMHGDIFFYNAEGEVITLHHDIAIRPCDAANHMAAVLILSPSSDPEVWKDLRVLQDSFKCSR